MPILYESVRKAKDLASTELKEITQKLKGEVSGEVRMDSYSRALYSTDASMYQMEPVGVVLPRNSEDVEATVQVALQHLSLIHI